jgi:hypothetical protein
MLKSIEEFKELKLGTRIYIVERYNRSIRGYYYAGISPVSAHVMLISDGDVSKMNTIYKNTILTTLITTKYDDAKLQMMKEKIKELESIKKIYFKEWSESEWRDFNINEIIENEE